MTSSKTPIHFSAWMPTLVNTLTIAVGMLVAQTSAHAQVTIETNPTAKQVKVLMDDEHFTTYHYGDNHHMPYLWPVLGEGGVGMTRNYPFGKDKPPVEDHPHHMSLYLTYGALNGFDFWHADARNPGRIRTVEVETGTTDDFAWLRTHNHWVATKDGENPVMEEIRELRFHQDTPALRAIDIITTFKATHGDVTFGDTKEGMLAVRMAPALDGDRGGILTNAHGAQGEKNVYGKPSPWIDYTGHAEGHGKRGIAIFDHPGNPHRGHWHVRNYGLAALNPFGGGAIANLPNAGHTLKKGESMTLRYRILVHSGCHEEADVAGQYQRFIQADDPKTGGENR